MVAGKPREGAWGGQGCLLRRWLLWHRGPLIAEPESEEGTEGKQGGARPRAGSLRSVPLHLQAATALLGFPGAPQLHHTDSFPTAPLFQQSSHRSRVWGHGRQAWACCHQQAVPAGPGGAQHELRSSLATPSWPGFPWTSVSWGRVPPGSGGHFLSPSPLPLAPSQPRGAGP